MCSISDSKEFRYKSFEEFYPFYIAQHMNPICRALHLFGFTISIV